MERVHYRRHTPSQLKPYQPQPQNERIRPEAPAVATAEPAPQESKLKEKLITQALISAVIFAVVLAITIADFPQAEEIRYNLSIALSENTTAEQVAGELRVFLGGAEYTSENAETTNYSEYPINPDYAGYTETPTGLPIEMPYDPITIAPRIDEEILNEAFGTVEGVNMQPTAPEPMIPPEL